MDTEMRGAGGYQRESKARVCTHTQRHTHLVIYRSVQQKKLTGKRKVWPPVLVEEFRVGRTQVQHSLPHTSPLDYERRDKSRRSQMQYLKRMLQNSDARARPASMRL